MHKKGRRRPNLMFRNFNLYEIVTEYAFHDGIRVKVFDFLFYFMETIDFPMFVGIIYQDHKANMTHIALFFDRTDGIYGVLGFQKTYLSPFSRGQVLVKERTRHSNKYNVQGQVVSF